MRAITCTRPTCSRRLFKSQYQLSSENFSCDLLSGGRTVPSVATVHSTVSCISSMPCHQYLSSTIVSTSQIHSALHHATLHATSLSEDKILYVAVSDLHGSVITPIEVLKAIWRKAFELLQEPKSVSFVPGQDTCRAPAFSYTQKKWAICSWQYVPQLEVTWHLCSFCCSSKRQQWATYICWMVLKSQESS